MDDIAKQKAKEKRAKKRKEQQRLFRKKLNALFKTEYRYSLKFEDAHVYDDGKAYINVDLTKCDSPFSIYSYENRINPEIYDYINQETEFLPVDIPVVINFDDDGKYDEDMRERIRKTVIRHYSLEYEDARYDLHKSRLFAFFSLLVGVAFLTLYIVLSFLVKAKWPDFSTFVDIVYITSWVFVWEAVDRTFVTGLSDTTDVLNYGQLALVEVQFGKPKTKNKK